MATDQTHGWNIWSITNLVAVRNPNTEEVGKCSHNTANVLEQRQTLCYRPEEQRTPETLTLGQTHTLQANPAILTQTFLLSSGKRVVMGQYPNKALIKQGEILVQGFQLMLSIRQSIKLF